MAGRLSSIAARIATSSPNTCAKPAAFAVQPDQRNSATSRAVSHTDASNRAACASCAASQPVRGEWSVGWPMLRSPMKASARTASTMRSGA